MMHRLPALPSSWTICLLGEMAKIQTGLAKGGRSVTDPIELPYLRVANVQEGRVDLSVIKTILVNRKDVNRYSLRSGDVLLTEGGDYDKLGRSAIWRGQLPQCLHQNHIFVVRCDTQRLMPEWLSIVCASSYGRRYFALSSKQSTNLASINSSQLRSFPVPVPPLIWQKETVRRHADAHAAIERAGELVSAKQEFKRGLTQQLLTGQRRFPGHDGESAACREMGARAADWPLRSLGELCAGVTRKNAGSECDSVLTVSGARGLIDQREYFSKTIAGDAREGYFLLRNGEFAYNRSRMSRYRYGAIKRLDRYDAGILSTLNICFRVISEDIRSDFLVQLFESCLLDRQLRRIAHEGARAHGLLNVTKADFFALNVPVPSLEEQDRIVNCLAAIDSEITHLQALAQALRKQKRGLMQRFFSAELDSPEATSATGEVTA